MKNLIASFSRVERGFWVFLVCALISTAAVASVAYQGPMQITDTNGTTQITLGSGSASAEAPGGNISLAKGTLVLTDTNLNNWGSGAGNATGATPTSDITVTFGTAEPEAAGKIDSNYQIILTTAGITPTAGAIGPFTLGDQYPNGFAVRNQWKHGAAVTFTWYKFRTTVP